MAQQKKQSAKDIERKLRDEAQRDLLADRKGKPLKPGPMQKKYPKEYQLQREVISAFGDFAVKAAASISHAKKLSDLMREDDIGLSKIQEEMDKFPINALTLTHLISLERERKPSELETTVEQSRRSNQIALMVKQAKQFGYEPLSIPVGGKAKIKRHCLDTYPEYFTSDGFDHAWKKASKQNQLRIANSERFT